MIEVREAAYARERRLVQEVNHRVRNNLASVMSLLDVGRRKFGEEDVAHFDSTKRRIHAMSRAHSILSQQHWSDVSVKELTRMILDVDHSISHEIHGDDVLIAANRCQALALVMNELAANAKEHGAFSGESGRLHVEIVHTPSGEARITWTERGGPPIGPPTSFGTGLDLVKGFLLHDMRGTFIPAFDSDGFSCVMEFPLELEGSSEALQMTNVP